MQEKARHKSFRDLCYNFFSTIHFYDYLVSFKIKANLNPFPNKPWFLHVYSASLLKTLWEKEKLLVTSNFSLSQSVFYPFRELSAIFIQFEIVCKLFQIGRVQNLSFGKGLTCLFNTHLHLSKFRHGLYLRMGSCLVSKRDLIISHLFTTLQKCSQNLKYLQII